MDDTRFIAGLESRDLDLLSSVEKTDLHNHASLGFRKSHLEDWADKDFPDAPQRMESWLDFAQYLNRHFHPIIYSRTGFEFSIRSALAQARSDSVKVLEMSIDSQVISLYADGAEGLVRFLAQAHADTAPDIHFSPEIGLNRELDAETLEERLIPLIETGYFKSIDLYGDELVGPPARFRSVFLYAGSKGLKRKAHAGEYRGAEFVRESVEVLELDEVQHGIAAADDKDVMGWLRRQKTQLNICPTSNYRLCRVSSIAEHPIRDLAEAGVRVTINSDDILVFDQSVSEEYLLLYQEGVFTAQELDAIRKEALNGHRP